MRGEGGGKGTYDASFEVSFLEFERLDLFEHLVD